MSDSEEGVDVEEEEGEERVEVEEEGEERQTKQLKLTLPKNLFISQQTLPSWQPLVSIQCVIGTLLVIFVLFIIIGVILLVFNSMVVEFKYNYGADLDVAGSSCAFNSSNAWGQPRCNISDIVITVEKDMEAPVYLYYELKHFYQNHRRYASSRSDKQLSGKEISASDARSDCYPMFLNDANQSWSGSDLTDLFTLEDVYNPCGLIAWSMFNDTFVLKNEAGDVICDSAVKSPTENCTNDGIAWPSDLNTKFKHQETNYTQWPDYYYNEMGHSLPDVTDPDFVVWMRTAALPTFRKLHRIITSDLPAGTYKMDVRNNFPVSSFGAEKSFILTTATVFGTKNLFLPVGYVVVAIVCLILAVVFLVAHIISLIREKAPKTKTQ